MSTEWNGLPQRPDVAGWHLLRIKTKDHLRPHEIGMEEVYHYEPGAELSWTRRENGSRHGWRPEHIVWNWDYVGALVLWGGSDGR